MTSSELLTTEQMSRPKSAKLCVLDIDFDRSDTVQRILAGKQTVLIKPVEPQPRTRNGIPSLVWRSKKLNVAGADVFKASPFGQVGDHLYVREPKDAARLVLRVGTVGIARLHFLSEEDLRDTGLRLGLTMYEGKIQNEFRYEWDKLYKRTNRGWDRNPWVWRMRFTRVPAP